MVSCHQTLVFISQRLIFLSGIVSILLKRYKNHMCYCAIYIQAQIRQSNINSTSFEIRLRSLISYFFTVLQYFFFILYFKSAQGHSRLWAIRKAQTTVYLCVYSSEINGLKKALIQTSSSPVRCSFLSSFDLVKLSLYLCFRTLGRMSDPFPEIKSKHSLVAKYVTQPIWDKLSRAVTATSGRPCLSTLLPEVAIRVTHRHFLQNMRIKATSAEERVFRASIITSLSLSLPVERATSGRSDIKLVTVTFTRSLPAIMSLPTQLERTPQLGL